MDLTRIVVHVENDISSEMRIRVAAALAAEHAAELVGVVANVARPSLQDGVPLNRDLELAQAAELQQRCSDATVRFRRAAATMLNRSYTIELPCDAVAGLLDASLLADLVVVGGGDERGEPIATRVVLGAPCPALVVPPGFAGSFNARRILVGWKDTAPTARALTGALPLLQRARAVLLVHVSERAPPRPGRATIRDAGDWLQRHGVASHIVELPPDPDDPGHVLLDEADRFGADLIVAGAWARNPFRERVLGGATATLLAQSELPLLLAH
jgi:nucleotide-binding universal stress UspA family protein